MSVRRYSRRISDGANGDYVVNALPQEHNAVGISHAPLRQWADLP